MKSEGSLKRLQISTHSLLTPAAIWKASDITGRLLVPAKNRSILNVGRWAQEDGHSSEVDTKFLEARKKREMGCISRVTISPMIERQFNSGVRLQEAAMLVPERTLVRCDTARFQ